MTEETQQGLAASAAALILTVDELRKVLAQVSERLETLSKRTDQQSKRVDQQGERADRQRTWTALTAMGLAADMALTVFMFVSFDHQATTNGQLATLIERQAATSSRLSVVVNDALCPLYHVFVRSYSPDSLDAQREGLAAYNATFDDIKKQYRALDCDPAPTAPPTK